MNKEKEIVITKEKFEAVKMKYFDYKEKLEKEIEKEKKSIREKEEYLQDLKYVFVGFQGMLKNKEESFKITKKEYEAFKKFKEIEGIEGSEKK